MSKKLTMDLVELKRDDVLDAIKSMVSEGIDPLQILQDCRHGMTIVGDRYQKGDYFIAELILSGEIFKEASAILEPYLAKTRPSKPLGKVILATLRGDIHDLGKNMVSSLLKAKGFEVYDLGVDVAPALVVEKVKEVKPEFLGFSALITSSFVSMKEATEMLENDGLRNHFKLMIGGGVTTPMVKEYIGADFHTLDAVEGVAYCTKAVGK